MSSTVRVNVWAALAPVTTLRGLEVWAEVLAVLRREAGKSTYTRLGGYNPCTGRTRLGGRNPQPPAAYRQHGALLSAMLWAATSETPTWYLRMSEMAPPSFRAAALGHVTLAQRCVIMSREIRMDVWAILAPLTSLY